MFKTIIFLFTQIIFVKILTILNKRKWELKLNNGKIAVISGLIFYFSIIITMIITKLILKNELNSFDLNNDDFFSANEVTFEQQKAMKNVTLDTGLNFALFFSIIYSLLYSFIVYVLLTILIKEKYQK
ncbi:hypothetical protein [Flavobacterium sp.]|uniref:hypothetical protein n=1 Tax=Flavobacterium sp. TaxID=239 RepID=UPI0037513B5A